MLKEFLEVGTYLSHWKQSTRQPEITDQADCKDYNQWRKKGCKTMSICVVLNIKHVYFLYTKRCHFKALFNTPDTSSSHSISYSCILLLSFSHSTGRVQFVDPARNELHKINSCHSHNSCSKVQHSTRRRVHKAVDGRTGMRGYWFGTTS